MQTERRMLPRVIAMRTQRSEGRALLRSVRTPRSVRTLRAARG